MTPLDILQFVANLAWPIAAIVAVSVGGAVANTWLKIRNGYPLEGMWGQSLHPKTSSQEMERIKLLGQENAQLRAELGSMKDRLQSVERIVTDEGFQLAREFKALGSEQRQ